MNEQLPLPGFVDPELRKAQRRPRRRARKTVALEVHHAPEVEEVRRLFPIESWDLAAIPYYFEIPQEVHHYFPGQTSWPSLRRFWRWPGSPLIVGEFQPELGCLLYWCSYVVWPQP